MTIHTADTLDTIEQCYPVIQSLRPHLTLQTYLEQVQRQQKTYGYKLVYSKDGQRPVSILGYRLSEYLAWGKVLYIDDFATHSSMYRRGHGERLLDWVIEKATQENCDQVHLDTGTQRHNAHRLYLKKHFKLSSLHLSMKLPL